MSLSIYATISSWELIWAFTYVQPVVFSRASAQAASLSWQDWSYFPSLIGGESPFDGSKECTHKHKILYSGRQPGCQLTFACHGICSRRGSWMNRKLPILLSEYKGAWTSKLETLQLEDICDLHRCFHTKPFYSLVYRSTLTECEFTSRI